MRVQRVASLFEGSTADAIHATYCDACNRACRRVVRLETESTWHGKVNLCLPCARHVAKVAGAA